ncbi:MAG TPA: methyltransferase domain-containing protein [Ferruginibacter sp.]|nr:methyltransferase domain-containing protein [Ferruginibacter sp.]
MVNLQQRSTQKELLDSDNIPFADIRQNMKELNFINTLLGGHSITTDGIKNFVSNGPLTICEIGCGGGDNMEAIYKSLKKKGIQVHFTGIDLKKECIDFAQQQYPSLPATWIVNDYKMTRFENKPAVIFSSLFCHHFTDDELVEMMQWMRDNSATGYFINDLHRNILAYYSIKWLTHLFSRSYLVKNDASVSVARGFKKKDWKKILDTAGIKNYTIQWKWAFRYLIVVKHG